MMDPAHTVLVALVCLLVGLVQHQAARNRELVDAVRFLGALVDQLEHRSPVTQEGHSGRSRAGRAPEQPVPPASEGAPVARAGRA